MRPVPLHRFVLSSFKHLTNNSLYRVSERRFYYGSGKFFYESDSTSLFLNSGTFAKTFASDAYSTIGVPFLNTGTSKGISNVIFLNTFTNKGTIEPGISLGTLYLQTRPASPLFNPNGSVHELLPLKNAR